MDSTCCFFKLNLTTGNFTTFYKMVSTFIAKVHKTFFLKPTNSQPTSGIFKYKIKKQENCVRVTIWYVSLRVHFSFFFKSSVNL